MRVDLIEVRGMHFTTSVASVTCRLGTSAVGVAISLVCLSPRPSATAPAQSDKGNVLYAAAKPILSELRKDLLPARLRTATPAELELAWADWISQHDVDIRARVGRGDEDSILNLTLFGVTFTKLPRVTERDIANMADGQEAPGLVQRRIDEMVAGIASPGMNERLQFARDVAGRRGIDPGAVPGKNQLRRWLDEGITRLVSEYRSQAQVIYDPATTSGDRSTLYQDRGLASDTTIFPAFGIEQALDALKSNGVLGAGSIRRVAIVGPGLDFTDKREGYDFYPQQTIQPFAVADSLIRLGLTSQNELSVTTFDINPRVNQHLEAARQRARAGEGYVLHLPRSSEPFRWTPFLVSYWERFGDRIGQPVTLGAAPDATTVQVRALRVRPAVVTSIIPVDLDIVSQRFEPRTTRELFDLIIATNILIYYDVFEQSLALANVAQMLRPSGVFLTNTAVPVLPSTPMALLGYTEVGYTYRPEGDRLFWYRRQ